MLTGFVIPRGELKKVSKRACLVLMIILIIALLIFNLAIPAEAAITAGSSTNANSGNGLSVTIAKPSGTVAGDVLVACIVATSASGLEPVVTAPAGWQLIRTTNAYQTYYYDMVTYYKVAGASEPANYTWSSTLYNISGGITRLTGVDVNHVLDVSAEAQGQGTSPATAVAPSVTTNYNNDIVINFFGSYMPLAAPYFAEQAGLTPLYEYAPQRSDIYYPPNIAAYHSTKSPAGSTGNPACLLYATASPVRWVAQTVAFKAAPRAYFQVPSSSDAEAAAARSIGVTLAPNAEGPVEINFTVSGTATPGSDYSMTTTSPVTVNAGSGSASIGFSIMEDSLYEQDETIIITITSGQEYFLTTGTQYVYTITNDDLTAPTPVVAVGDSRTGMSPDTGITYPPPASAAVLSIYKPTGTVSGDFLLAAISWHSYIGSTITPPAGWTLIRSSYYEGIKVATYYKIANSSDASISTYTFDLSTNPSIGWHATGGITRYTGVDVVTPIDVSGAAWGSVDYGNTIGAPSVYPNYPSSRVITVFGTYYPVDNISTPTGMSERYEVHYHFDPNYTFGLIWPEIAVSDMNWPPATATGVRLATVTGSSPEPVGTSTNWVAQTIALKTSQLSINDVSFTEGNSGSTNATVTVSLDHPTNVPVTFNWLTADGTAAAHYPYQPGDDYIVSGGSNYVIPAGQTSYQLVVPIYGDAALEANETFYINLTSVTGATVADSQGAVTVLNDDSNITINDISQNEGNAGTSNFNFTVTINPVCSLPVSVTYFVPANEGTATQSTDYYFTQGTLNIAAGQSTGTISIPVIGDTVYESNETFVVYLSGATNAQIADNRGTGTITNDDAPIPTLSINDVSRAEGNSGTANMVFTVSLSNASASNVSVNFATAAGTAAAGSDYTLTSGTLNIAAGQTTGTITVPILGDTTYEPNETFSVILSSPTNATINDGTGTGTITNDDVLTMSINDVSLAEGNSGITNFIFTVTMNGASASPVTVNYATSVGTASIGPDYNSIATATLTFNPGETSKPITVQVNGETAYEDDETFFVNLSSASGASISDGQGVGTIQNDDVLLTYALTMAVSPVSGGSASDLTGTSPYVAGAPVSINAMPVTGYHFVNWTAPAGSFANANAAATTFTMPAQAVIVTANFALDTFTVTFDAQGGSAVNNQTVISGGLVVRPGDPGRSGYAFAGWYKDADCTDDWVFAVDTVTADTTLYARWAVLDQFMNPYGLSHTAYGGTFAQTFSVATTGGLYKVSCYLSNQSPITLTTQIQGVTAGDTPNGTVLRSHTINVPAGGARWVDVYITEPLPIMAGERYAIIWSGFPVDHSASIYGSADYAGGRGLMLSLSTWYEDSLYDFCFRTFVLTTPGITATPAAGLVTTETGGTAPFTVVLDTQPTADVTIALSSSDTTEGTASPASLTFTSANWNTPQTVTITGADDALSDGDIPYTITATASSVDLSYNGKSASVSVTNFDVEGTPPVVSANPANQSITYGADTSFTAAATGSPSPTVTWMVSTDGGSTYTLISDGGGYSGATTTTLSLTRPPVSYSGYRYKAVFVNGIGPMVFSGEATLTVSTLGITGSFTAADKVYDGTTAAIVTGRSLTGVLTDDVVSLSGGTAAFASRNADIDKTVTLTGSSLIGADAGNYSLSSVASATADITQKSVTPAIVANDKGYDGTTAATLSSQSVSGKLNPDVVTLVVGAANFASENAGTWTVTATSLSLGGADAANYSLSAATATDTATISAHGLTITGAIAENKIYNGSNNATVDFTGATLVGRIGSDVVSINSAGYSATFSNENVGDDKAVTVLGVSLSGADAANYTVAQPLSLMADITALGVTGSFTAANKVYDGTTTAAVTGRSLTGVLAGDVVSLSGGTAAFADKNAGTDKTVTLTGAGLAGTDAANYSLTSVATATANITAKSVTPAIVANDKGYDGTTAATLSSQSVSGAIAPDTVTLVVGSANFASKNAGSWIVTASSLSLGGADAANYSLSAATATDTANITAHALTITGAVAGNKIYNGSNAATVNFTGATLVGRIGSDVVSINSAGYTATFSNENVGDDKPVTVQGVALSGADAANYTVAQPVGLTADITALGVTGSFTTANKVYDRTTAAAVTGRSLTGVLAGDVVSLSGGTAAFADKNAGTDKTVTLTGAGLAGTDAANYSLTSVATATANITAKSVTPAIIANDKGYDGTTTATLSSQTVSGAIAPDTVTLVVGSANFASSNAGAWIVTASSLSLGGTDAANYTLSAATATDTATITAHALTITGAVAGNKVYNGSNVATVNFSGAELAGVIEGDSVSINSAGYTATFSNENVGDDKPVTVTGVILSGVDAANYTVAQPLSLTADITALGVTGSFTAANKVYDGTTAAAVTGRYLTGVLAGDAVSLNGGTAAFASKNAGTGKSVTLTGAGLAGTDAANYSLSSIAPTTANITAKSVTPAIVANDKGYDGTTTATLSSQTVSGVIAPDTVTLVVGSANFASKNAGSWIVTASSLSLGGADAANYSLSAATATDTANITAHALTITGAVAGNKIYNGNNAATVNFTGASLTGVLEGDVVSINSAGYSATFSDENVGDGKPVTVLGVALSGADAANYTVSQPVGLTADITALGITGSFTAADKVYDGTTAAIVTGRSLTGVLAGDVVSLSGGTAAFASRNAGIDKTVTLTGAVLTGADAGNYSLSSVASTTADITVRSIEVTAVANTKVYDGTTSSSGIPTITSSAVLATGDSAIWSQTFDTKDAGTGKVLTPAGAVNDGNSGANYQVSFVTVSTGVIEKATLTVTAENKTSQYSEPRLPFTVVYSGFIPGETLATCGISGSPDYTTDPGLSSPITENPGPYSIIPSQCTLAANNYKFTFVNGTYTVTPEDAAIAFDSQNPVSVKVMAANENNSAFIWKAIITQANDGNLGDLCNILPENITLRFTAIGSGGGWSGPATSFDPETGIATFSIPEDVLGVETYSAVVSLSNNCFQASSVENVLVIYDPSLGFTTGGGWFYWPAGTANPELEGAKTNFGFTMKYNRKGTSVQGSFLLIAHLDDGSIIRIKSNAVYGMAILENTYPGIASFSGKCVYSRVDAYGNVLATAGNQDFMAYVKDMNEPGSGTDMFWFNTKLTIAGEDPFSLDANSDNKVDEQEYVALGGGNILVPHKSSSSDGGTIDEDLPPNNGKKK